MSLAARRDSTVITVVYASGASRSLFNRSATSRTGKGVSAAHSAAITSASNGPRALPPPDSATAAPFRRPTPTLVLRDCSITLASLATRFGKEVDPGQVPPSTVGLGAIGSRTLNREPAPGVLVTPSLPACCATTQAAIASPSPVPVLAAALRPR